MVGPGLGSMASVVSLGVRVLASIVALVALQLASSIWALLARL